MRLRNGGFTPKLAGRPVDEVTEVPLPERLLVDLVRRGTRYRPTVRQGDRIALGDPIATASTPAGVLVLPAPASGRISDIESDSILTIETAGPTSEASSLVPLIQERASAGEMREALVRGGVWPLFWSAQEQGIPRVETAPAPRAIVINFILTEPFRARGRIVIEHSWQRIMAGIRFLQHLISDYGTIE
ncbi:MAG TPA: hypothetical protein VMW69_13890, partial [Spirochaetia bacterium]|nr:hypothetical protein [Spirochaetia bacterium]